ncbi:microneme protein MIC4 [Besnoitia besnoiti]|uniref:Microneme protein MIC4 n=1 Tax=Besnoitia besnoiti TaxID=94643 RepID=A0A2A9MLG1_BESBE|nr:microneme protein MIC4 [Besnoitia besnoiti]PFH36300.1 microneme protein MIC4 [Besnoitia besnoiti]
MKLVVFTPACLLVGLLGQPEETAALRSKALAPEKISRVDCSVVAEQPVSQLQVGDEWSDPHFTSRACLYIDVGSETPHFKEETRADLESCRLWCNQYRHCSHFTYGAREQRCYLKSGAMKRRGARGDITGPRICDISTVTLYGVESTVPSIEETQTTAASQCREKCAKNAKCSHYTWNSGNRRCYLKSGRMSPRRSQGGETSSPCEWYDVGSESEGVSFHCADKTECLIQCQGTNWCTHATYNAPEQMCHLKKGTPKNRAYKDDVTMMKTCAQGQFNA